MSTAPARLILVNLGTPAQPTAAAVRSFLDEFLSDPAVIDLPRWLWQPILRGIVLRRRPRRVAELYRSIWTEEGSPLRAGTGRIAREVASRTAGAIEVTWACRYGEPSLERAVVGNDALLEAGEHGRSGGHDPPAGRDSPLVVLPLYGQRTSSTTETVFDEVRRLAESHGLGDRLRRAQLAPDDPGYIEALADRYRRAVDGARFEPEHLLVSFHGIPARYDRREGSRYRRDCARTHEAVLEALGWPQERATLCYQSKFGPEPWLRPATADLLAGLPRRGVRRLAVMTPGFLTEGLETLEEIGIRGRETFLENGGADYLRIPVPEDHPALAESLSRLGAAAAGVDLEAGGNRESADGPTLRSLGGRGSTASPGPGSGRRPVSRRVTAALLARYDRPGPRYTSYPTAVEFHEGVGAGTYEGLLARANEAADQPLSLYLHLPFCEHRCLFCGCHVIVTPHHDRTLPYLRWLEREIDAVAERLPDRRRFSQLHLGGGTPTYHRPEELSALLRHLMQRFRPTDAAELAVEVDPRVTRREHLEALAAHGFNRVSLGVQDFDPEVQKAIERLQSRRQTEELVEAARELGFRGINVDLIYGLPQQRPESFRRTVEAVVAMGADRCAVYSFAYVPWIRGHQTRLDARALPGRELKFQLFATAREGFLSAGYEPIGMDHFALPDDELAEARRQHRLQRNFQGYTVVPAPDSIGMGVSAIGDVRGTYVQNHKKLSAYEECLEAGGLPVERGVTRSDDDELRRDVIQELMCNFRVDMDGIEGRHGIEFESYFATELRDLAVHEREDLVRIGERKIEATGVGELFIRNLAMCFDRYTRERREHGGDKVFSRTV